MNDHENMNKKDDLKSIFISVPDNLFSHLRLDVFLGQSEILHARGISRTRVQALINEKNILVNSIAQKASFKLSGGEIIEIILPVLNKLDLIAQEIELDIIYEDRDLIVVNKASGMVVHPGAGAFENTLVNALLFHCKGELSGIGGTERPGIVHRLDKDTSGLMIVAKNDYAHQNLAKQIEIREASRVYFALVEGSVVNDSGLIDKSIARHKKDRLKMAVSSEGKPAQTYFEVIQRWHKFSLIKAKLKTGRTHQIRVHMASINCPVVGDIVYNRKTTGSLAARAKLGLTGQALHAAYLSFRHPRSGDLLEFESELPNDFYKLISSL